MSDKVKLINVSDVKIGERFRKDYGDMTAFVESIKDKGILQPITVNQDMELLAGGRRMAAATMAELKKIPALIRDQSAMDNAAIDLREVELIENIFRKDFTWDEQAKLVAEIDKMCREKNIEWSVRKTAKLLGHSHPMNVSRSLQLAEALEAVPELSQCKTQDEAIKVLKKVEENAVTQELRRRQEVTQNSGLRDVLKIAKANYRIGDALIELSNLPSGSGNLHFIEVDPPYGIDLNEQKSGNTADTYKEIPRNEYAEFLATIARETYRIAGSHCWMVFWFGPTHHQLVLQILRDAGWQVDDIPCIWNKGHGQTQHPGQYLARTYEPFFSCRKGTPTLAKQGRSNVFDFPSVSAMKKIHPTERPVALIEEIIATYVGVNSRVLIPFLGSGATLRAVYNMGCTGWGYDLNPEYRDKFLLSVQEDTEKLDNE